MLLKFGDIVVGEVTDAFEHQGTWFGDFQADLRSLTSSQSLLEYIEFCQDWSQRCAADEAEAAEFDRFKAWMPIGSWNVVNNGQVQRIEQPMFNAGLRGEISWCELR